LPIPGGPQINFLLGVLNSRLLSWYFLQRSNIGHRDDFPKIVLKETRELPIPNAKGTEQAAIVSRVDDILSAKSADPLADTSAWEREIDERVYRLYGLTAEEIRIVEGASHR
jgi:hypothetical protein